jgi:selenocysteine-specific elongation factor
MKQIVLGTAGHIDHGKTTLIKALTGIETDRLKEEKARGITIELGFAHLDLPGGLRLGIVDVPGHEKFVKNMVAGAAGIDLVMLVIAADEGVMPQTREHLDICRLLGVEHGLVALTKVDMVDQEWLELVTEDVRDGLAQSFLAEAPIIPVSGVSGQGVDELIAALDGLASAVEERPAAGPFRLPVDRVFSMKGFGTVITGTALGGSVSVGQPVTIYPRDIAAKVRGLQVHNQEVTAAGRGQRTAMNFQGLDKESINRGDVVATPDSLVPSLWVDVEVFVLEEAARPLKHRAPVRFHAGSAEILGRVHTLDREELAPGASAICQLRLDEPATLMAGDRYVLRSYSPVHTIAGGVVVHPHPGRHKRHRPEIMDDLAALRGGEPEARVVVAARLAGNAGVAKTDLARLVNLLPKELDAIVERLLSRKRLVRFDKEGGRMVSGEVLAGLMDQAVELVGAFHRQQPLKPGMSREELRQRLARRLDAKLFALVAGRLAEEGRLVAEKDLLRLPEHQVRLAGGEAKLKEKIEAAYREGGWFPPNLKDVIAGEDAKRAREVVGVLVNQGALTRVKEDLYYHTPALEELKAKLVEHLRQEGRTDAQAFKELTGLSRKYLIPLLEHFDAVGLTMRVGDERVLRKGSA